jgi:ribonuclease I (enterobacter ribonuclease)
VYGVVVTNTATMIRKVSAVLACAIFVLVFAARSEAAPLQLVPGKYADFDVYTFALTWQPGICSVDDGPLLGPGLHDSCSPDQLHMPLIGVHGLWPSMPQTLIKTNVPVQQWFARGCDLLRHSEEAPPISGDLKAQLATVMPQLSSSLLTHEYDKHVQCFEFDATQFFMTELQMRAAVADSPFGQYLIAHAGATVALDDVHAVFEKSFGTPDGRALQVQCGQDSSGRSILTQLWITLHANAVAAFPAGRTLTHTPIDRDGCPAAFFIPAW